MKFKLNALVKAKQRPFQKKKKNADKVSVGESKKWKWKSFGCVRLHGILQARIME